MVRITDWLGGLFKGDTKVVNTRDFREENWNKFYIQAFAVYTTVEMIATLMANIEYKTYRNNVEYKGEIWYALNYKPNNEQNSTEFWQEFWSRLLYDLEVLVVQTPNNKFVIADGFTKEYISADDVVFSGITRNGYDIPGTFRMQDVVYLKYSNSNVKAMLDNILGMYNDLMNDAKDKYKKRSGERGSVTVDAIAYGDKNFEEKFSNLMNKKFATYFNSKNAVIPLPKGYTYNPISDGSSRTISEVTDISNVISDALAMAAQAYKVAPALVRGEVAGLADAFDMTLTTCIDPFASMGSEEWTNKLYKPVAVYQQNSYIAADTSCIKHFDVFDLAAHIDKLIACGFFSPNEARVKSGIQVINEEWADAHYITKNYENAHGLSNEGGENNGGTLGNKTVGNTEGG